MIDPHLGRIARSLGPLDFPRRFAVEVCADCNLNCSMCHHDSMVRPKGKMPLELWKRCADQVAAQAPDTEVWFSFCGEPLLEPVRLLDMLAYGQWAGLHSMNVNTNGVHLVESLLDPLLSAGLQRIVIGVDGHSKKVFESIRIGADRDLVYANVERLLEARARRSSGPEVMVQYIVMDENEAELDAFRKHWSSRGATLKIRNQLSWGGRFDTPLSVAAEDRIPCPWALTMMHVFWDGRVPRCPGDTEGDEAAGNAWDEPLATLWQRLGAYRDLHLSHRFKELPERCQTCKDWMTGAAERERPRPASSGTRGLDAVELQS